ncbi:MAG: putative DNA base hypermodification protein [Alphaproteobacteria bacterium]|nr:putative DNA base hypermodification protein [Alphaproteobacteria bacterium]
MIDNFFEFLYDRQNVWHKRSVLKESAPWSDDEILQNFRFCNVYRELDGGTIALTKYLETNLSSEQKLFNIIAYRFFNRRDTIENLFGGLLNPDEFDWKAYEKRFDEIKQRESIFSNAYLITAHAYKPTYRPQDKHVQILLMLDELRKKLSEIIEKLRKNKPQKGLEIIQNAVPMAGPFLSGQILLDVTYAKGIVDYTANDFLIVGPGALWGLNIIFNKKLKPQEADEKCRYLHSIQKQKFTELLHKTGKNWLEINWKRGDYPNYPYLALHDVQNALCEFRKYWRLKNGEKAKKRYYKG